MKTVLFYISGHGYGHAVRMGEVMRELRHLHADWRILARTQAPRQILPSGIEYSPAELDSGVVEQRAGVVIDEAATKERLLRFLARWDSIVEAETRYVIESGADLLVADIPPIAGDVASAAGRPCIGIANFTWDWIYEPYAKEYLDRLENGYSRIEALLRLPFAQSERLDSFARIIDVPLIARKASGPIPQSRVPRVRVFLGSRAQVSDEALARARDEGREFEFVLPPSGPGFTDVLASCDLVVAKLGFSMVAECIAAGKPILYPPRENFREEAILQRETPAHLACLPIPLPEFYRGAWAPFLRALRAMPAVPTGMRTDGARVCADLLADLL